MLDWQKIDAVIFDMDGTLVDSMAYWQDLPANWFQAHNLALPPDLDQMLETIGLFQAAQILSPKFAPEEPPEAVFALLQSQMDGHYAQDIPLFPGVRELLAALTRTGKKMCIATMTDRPQVQTMLRTQKLEGVFDFLLTTPEVGSGKNQPTIFLEACRRFGLPPRRVAVFEDSRTAAQTVLALGMPLVFLHAPGQDCRQLSQLAAASGAPLHLITGYGQLPLPI